MPRLVPHRVLLYLLLTLTLSADTLRTSAGDEVAREDYITYVWNMEGRPPLDLLEVYTKLKASNHPGKTQRVLIGPLFHTYSTRQGIIGLRMHKSFGGDHIFYDMVLVGVHPTEHEPPPFPYRNVPTKLAGIQLLDPENKLIAAHGENAGSVSEDERYFGEKCRVRTYGPGHLHWRYFICRGRVVAMALSEEP